MKNVQVIAGADGGALNLLDSDGVVVLELGVPPGITLLSTLQIPEDLKVEEGRDAKLVVPSPRVFHTQPNGLTATAANPNFKPSDAQRTAREFEMRLSAIELSHKRALRQARLERQAHAQRDDLAARQVEQAALQEQAGAASEAGQQPADKASEAKAE